MTEQLKRIQRRRVKGWRMPENTISVTRPGKYGNPFQVGQWLDFPNSQNLLEQVQVHTPELAVLLFESYLKEKLADEPDFLEPLRGKDLACFCAEDALCHADILLREANK